MPFPFGVFTNLATIANHAAEVLVQAHPHAPRPPHRRIPGKRRFMQGFQGSPWPWCL